MNEDLRSLINDALARGDGRVPSGELLTGVSRVAGADRAVVRQTIRDMVAAGDLTYTSLGGTNFLESSFDRPMRLADHIIVKPPHKRYQAEPGDVVINIGPGSAFGTGAHPTTRLMLRALDRLFHDHGPMLPAGPLRGLDIGTGSGILAIAVACLGVPEVVATDVDPCAVWEARYNASANNVEQQVGVTDGAFSTLNGRFSLIVANLAGPTLADLAATLKEKTALEGILIISGFRDDLLSPLEDTFGENGFAMASHTTLRGWACLVLKKPSHERGEQTTEMRR